MFAALDVRERTPKKSSSSSAGAAEGRVTFQPVAAGVGVADDDDVAPVMVLEGRDTAQPSDDIIYVYSNEEEKLFVVFNGDGGGGRRRRVRREEGMKEDWKARARGGARGPEVGESSRFDAIAFKVCPASVRAQFPLFSLCFHGR